MYALKVNLSIIIDILNLQPKGENMQTKQNYDKDSLESVLKYLVEKYGAEILSGSVLLDFYSALKDDYSVMDIMIRNGTFKSLFALKKSGKPKNECSAGINAELKSLKESVPSDKAKKYILMAARLAGFNVRDSQTPAPTQAPRKPAPDKNLTAQQKTSGAKTAAQATKSEATSLNQLETLLLPPSKTAAAPSRPAKTSRPVSRKNEFLRLCRSGNARKIEAALKNGADANTKDDNGRTVFFLWGGRTALMWAVIFDRAKAEEILLKYGADVNARDDNDRTALMIAASYGHTESIRLLLKYGADIDAEDNQGRTPAIMAAEYGHTESIRLLLNHGANINAATTEGRTALMSAQEGGYTEAANLISSYRHTKTPGKPAANCKPKSAARNENHNTAIAVKNDRTEVNVTNQNIVNQAVINNWNVNIYFDASDIALLCEQDKEIHVRDKHGRTALHLAVCRNDTEETEYLLKCGANVNARDNNGHTALFDAAYSGHTEAARLLMQHGADVNCTYHDKDYSDGITVLHVAKLMKHYETANVILAFGGMDSHPVTTAINETVETAGKIALVAGKLATDTAGAIVDTTGNIITGTANAIS